MKQTAVNWLIEQMQKGELQSKFDKNKWTLSQTSGNDILKQAIEMEKNQIIDTFLSADSKWIGDAEEFYNMEYNKNEIE